MKVTEMAISYDVTKLKKELRKVDKSSNVNDEQSVKLENFFKTIKKTLESELYLRKAYILSEKRLGLDKLQDHAEHLFADGIFYRMPLPQRIDFIEAGKCLAFERPTAAAFHILRGTEGILRAYYLQKIKKKDRINILLWKPMIDQLRTIKNTPKSLLDAYDNLRENFRNPTIHPEITYTMDEAQDLFSVCIDAVNKIVKVMKP
ncbi:MAG: hypothetical protein KGL95_11015 [Patescibacteria group bacterium]|nr:hypothetical protein [Patescibacteria group bacterium]